MAEPRHLKQPHNTIAQGFIGDRLVRLSISGKIG